LFDGFEEGFEVSGTEALMIPPLNDFNENSWSVFNWFCKYL